jgi:hypothetical protein
MLVEQVNREDAELRQPRNQVRDLFEQVAEIQHRADLSGQLGEDCK